MGKSIHPTGTKGLARPLTLHAATTFFVSPLLGAGTLRTFKIRQTPDRYAPLSRAKQRKAALTKQVAFSTERRIVTNLRQLALSATRKFYSVLEDGQFLSATWRLREIFGRRREFSDYRLLRCEKPSL